MRIQEHVSLKEFTTMRVGGTARYFVSASTAEDIAEAVLFAKERRLPYAVLGGGSNVLIADGKFSGLIVKVDVKGIGVIARIRCSQYNRKQCVLNHIP